MTPAGFTRMLERAAGETDIPFSVHPHMLVTHAAFIWRTKAPTLVRSKTTSATGQSKAPSGGTQSSRAVGSSGFGKTDEKFQATLYFVKPFTRVRKKPRWNSKPTRRVTAHRSTYSTMDESLRHPRGFGATA